MVIVMMDEYVLTADDGTLSLPDRSAHYSCQRFGKREILNAVSSGLPPSRGIPVQDLWMPDLASRWTTI
jgi:glucosamine-6-phosphate deaminase